MSDEDIQLRMMLLLSRPFQMHGAVLSTRETMVRSTDAYIPGCAEAIDKHTNRKVRYSGG